MSKKSYLFAVSLCLAATMGLYGCSGQSAEKPAEKPAANAAADKQETQKEEQKKTQEVSLSEWNGSWNNIVNYLDDPELAASFEEVGKRENISGDEAKAKLKERRKFEYGALKVEGNKMSFFDNFEDKGGKLIGTGEYKFVKSEKVKHGNHDLEFDLFEATNADAPQKFIALMPIHGEESLTHFHMRYGSDADKLLDPESKWFPALVKTTTTMDQLKDEITE